MHRRLAALLFAVPLALHAAEEPRPMTAVDLLGVPVQGEIAVSPSGDEILFTRSEASWKEDRAITHIWRVDRDGALQQMTNGKTGERSPSWNPDGAAFCFVATRDGDEHDQVFVQSARGGEAFRVTEHATSVSSPVFSADGTRIYFLADDEVAESQRRLAERSGDVISFDRDFQHAHVWQVDVETRREQRVTGGGFSVLDFALSDDGRRMIYRSGPTPLYDDWDDSEVYFMDLEEGEPTRLTENHVAESGASLSPDGSTVLFVAEASAGLEGYHQGNLFVVPADGGATEILAPDFPHEVLAARWTTEGSILFLANLGVRTELFLLSPATGQQPRRLTFGDHTVARFHRSAAGIVGWIASTPESPGDVWVSPESPFSPRRLTRFEEEVAESFVLPRTEVVSWTGRDGERVEGILTLPHEHRRGSRWPLVVQTHGGPASSSTLRFPSWATYGPVLAAHGYATLQPNYRGSTGYGDRFMRDMVGHYFNQADDDVIAGTEAMIDRGVADAEHLATMGWSAGGHMTNWLITRTEIFGAASSGAGAANWISMYGQSDVRTYRTPWFLGTPWEAEAPIETYLAHSPITHVANARTPTLILVGEKDVRVPMSQSVELFRALRSVGVDTELLVFPGQPHGLRRLKHRLHKINAEIAWFERHLFGRDYEMEVPPGGGDTEE